MIIVRTLGVRPRHRGATAFTRWQGFSTQIVVVTNQNKIIITLSLSVTQGIASANATKCVRIRKSRYHAPRAGFMRKFVFVLFLSADLIILE